jgi:hypothetical protein
MCFGPPIFLARNRTNYAGTGQEGGSPAEYRAGMKLAIDAAGCGAHLPETSLPKPMFTSGQTGSVSWR